MAESGTHTILIVDDESGNIDSLRRILQREGYDVLAAHNGREGLDLLRQHNVSLLLTDMMMPGMNGLDLLKAAKAISPHTEVIMVTAYGSIENAVETIKQGAYDYITKPLKRRDIVKTVQKALEKVALMQENLHLRKQIRDLEEPPLIIGQSGLMRRTLEIVKQVAPTTATVLIRGEPGTGKELIAHEIHRLSPRHDRRFVAVNCTAFPETLLDSELFGYEKGAFTGAYAAKPGRFEIASGGTLFLDEIGEISQSVQVKLLRVIQERQIERLGSTKPTNIDLRLLTATNRDLAQDVKDGRFREDLYFRLNVIEIHLPPLRDRPEDIPLLVQHFLDRYTRKNDKPPLFVAPETMSILQNYAWPGNIRQVENVMQRAAILAPGPMLRPEDLPPEIHESKTMSNHFTLPFGTPLEEIERYVIHETLRRTGDKKLAAQILGIATRTIYRKLEAQQEEKEHDQDSDPSDANTPSPDLHNSASLRPHEGSR